MRRIYITESQLKSIMREGLLSGVYNNKDDEAAAEPQNLDGIEVAVSDTIDGIDGEHEHTDKPIPDSIKLANKAYGMKYLREDKKKITEANKNTDNKQIKFNTLEKERIANDARNGSKVAQNIVDRGFKMTSNNANVLKSRGGSDGMSSKVFNNINGKNKNVHDIDTIVRNSASAEDAMDFSATETPNASKGTGKGHHTNGEQLSNGGTVYYHN